MTWIDRACALVAAATALLVAFDADLALRPVAALIFVLVVPGWTILRLGRAPVTPLTALAAVILSISIAMISSYLTLALLGWAWRPVAVLTAVACLAGLTAAEMRDIVARHPRSAGA